MVRNRLVSFALIIFSFICLNAQASLGSTEKFKAIGPSSVVCTGSLITLSSNGGNNAEYIWFPAKHFVNNTLKTVKTRIRKTTAFMVVKVDLHSQKRDTAKITVIVNEERLNILGEGDVCDGDSTYLLVPPAFKNPVWNTGEKSMGIWVKQAGIYRVEAEGDCNLGKGAIQIKTLNEPIAVITTFGNLDICEGESVKLGAFKTPFNYVWSTGETSSEISVNKSKNVTLSVFNKCGIATDNKKITVHNIDASFIPSKMDGEIPFTLNLYNESRKKATDKWFVNGLLFSKEKDAALFIDEEGDYDIELVRTNDLGCENRMKYASIVARPPAPVLLTPDNLIVVPNSFTPNGDGLNDTFLFQSNFVFDIEFSVFDRWGHEVYHSDGGNEGWNGNLNNGELAAPGRYIIRYAYTDLDGKPVSKTMQINLLR